VRFIVVTLRCISQRWLLFWGVFHWIPINEFCHIVVTRQMYLSHSFYMTKVLRITMTFSILHHSRCARKKEEDNVRDNEARLETIIYNEQELPDQFAQSFAIRKKSAETKFTFFFLARCFLELHDRTEKLLPILHFIFRRFLSLMTRKNIDKVVKHNDKAFVSSHYFLIVRFFDQRDDVI